MRQRLEREREQFEKMQREVELNMQPPEVEIYEGKKPAPYQSQEILEAKIFSHKRNHSHFE